MAALKNYSVKKVERLSKNFHLDTDIILHVVKRYAEYQKVWKNNFIKFERKSKVAAAEIYCRKTIAGGRETPL